jgi:thermitase
MQKSWLILIILPAFSWAGDYSDNELLLTLSEKKMNPIETLKTIGAKSFESLELIDKNSKDFFKSPIVVSFDDTVSIETRVKNLIENPNIKNVQLNYKYTIQGESAPNDPLLKNQWEHKKADIQKVWNETTDCGQKIVAVLDTGINFTHADLLDSAYPKSYNAINSEENVIDFNGHGTLMASIIGAKGDNRKGVTGICWATKIMAVKVLNEAGEGYSSDIIKGISFAVKNKASILNLSFGSYFSEDSFLKKSLEKAISKGLIAVVPAGNQSADTEKKRFWPCSFKLKGMLCVASTKSDGNLADFSNFSEKEVDLAAPGENIFGIAPGSFKEIKDNFEDGWGYSEDSGIMEAQNCLSSNKKLLGIPKDFCKVDDLEKLSQWAKKDFGGLVSTFDFSYVQFSAKTVGRLNFLINQEFVEEISEEQSEYFIDLGICRRKNNCLLEFSNGEKNSKVAIGDFRIWGLTLGNSTYQRKTGSSLSAAYVTGLVALIGTFNPKFSAEEVIHTLKEGSRFSKKLQGKIGGARMVDPFGQLKFLSKPNWN